MDFTSNVLSIDNNLSGPLFVGVLINFCKENVKTFIEFAQKKNQRKSTETKRIKLIFAQKITRQVTVYILGQQALVACHLIR